MAKRRKKQRRRWEERERRWVRDDSPPIAGEADMEFESRIEAERVRAEWRLPLRPAVAQSDHRELPLFGGLHEQGGLFGE